MARARRETTCEVDVSAKIRRNWTLGVNKGQLKARICTEI